MHAPAETLGSTLTTVERTDIVVRLYERTFDATIPSLLGYGSVTEGKTVYLFRTNQGVASTVVREITAVGDGTFEWTNLEVDPQAPAQPAGGAVDGGAEPRQLVKRHASAATGQDGLITLSPTSPRLGKLHFLLVPERLDNYRIAQYVLNADGLLDRRALTVPLATLVDQRLSGPPSLGDDVESDTAGSGEPEPGGTGPPPSEAFMYRVATAAGGADRRWGLVLADHRALATEVHRAYDAAVREWDAYRQAPGQEVKMFHAGLTDLALQMYEAQRDDRPTPAEVESRRPRWAGWEHVRRFGDRGLDTYLAEVHAREDRKDALGALLYERLLPHPETRQAVVDPFTPYLPAPVRHELSAAAPDGSPGRLEDLDDYATVWVGSASDGDLSAVNGLVGEWADWLRDAAASPAGKAYVQDQWGASMDPGHYVMNSALFVRRLLMAGATEAGDRAVEAAGSLAAAREQREPLLKLLRDRIGNAEQAAGDRDEARRAYAEWLQRRAEARAGARSKIGTLNDRALQSVEAFEEAAGAVRSSAASRGGNAGAMYGTLRALRSTLLARSAALGLSLPGAPGGYPLGQLGTVVSPPAHLPARLRTLWAETYWLWASLHGTFNDVEFPAAYLSEKARDYAEAGDAHAANRTARATARAQVEARQQALEQAREARRQAQRSAEAVRDSQVLRRALDAARKAEREAQALLDEATRQANAVLGTGATPRPAVEAAEQLAEDLSAQKVRVAEVGRGALRWERAAVGLHGLGVWFAIEATYRASATGRTGGRAGAVALEVVGTASALLDLSVGIANLRTTAVGASQVRTLAYVRVSAALEVVYFGAHALIELSEGDRGAATGFGIMAAGSLAVLLGFGLFGILAVAAGIAVLVLFSDTELEAWLKQSYWGVEGEYDRLDAAVAWFKGGLLDGADRFEQEVVDLFGVLVPPRISVRLVSGDALYDPALHAGAPDLVVRVEPGLFDPSTMEARLRVGFNRGGGAVTGRFPLGDGGGPFVASEVGGRYGWTARLPASSVWGDALSFPASLVGPDHRRLRADASVTFSFNEHTVAGRSGFGDLSGRLSGAPLVMDGHVGYVRDRWVSRKEGVVRREAGDGVLSR